jgi:hypothetical protein
MDKFKYKIRENDRNFKVGDIDVGDEGGISSTVTGIDSDTGTVSWDVEYIPNLDKLLDDSEELYTTSKVVSVKSKNDSKFKDIYAKAKSLRNIIRTHVRNNYPEEYKKSKGVNESNIEETSTTGGGEGSASFTGGTGMQYTTPNAFGKGKKTKNTKGGAYTKNYGYKLVPNKIKGSGIEVKSLFNENQTPQSFQQERVASFGEIEQQLNEIYKMLSNAKNETLKYYTDNTTSYDVVKPTDLILDYIKDIKKLLTGK